MGPVHPQYDCIVLSRVRAGSLAWCRAWAAWGQMPEGGRHGNHHDGVSGPLSFGILHRPGLEAVRGAFAVANASASDSELAWPGGWSRRIGGDEVLGIRASSRAVSVIPEWET